MININKTLNLEMQLTVSDENYELGNIIEKCQITLNEKSLGKVGWAILYLAIRIGGEAIHIFNERTSHG